MFIGGIILLTTLLQCSAKSVSQKYPDITEQCTASSGQIYNVGSVFTDNNCTTRCECLDDSILSCQPLCSVMKANSFCANLKIVHNPVALPDAEGKSCSCPSSTCEPEFCYDGDKKHKPGERFISADCFGSCECGPGGSVFCDSLCPPVHTRCGIDEEKVQSSRKIANSNCTCPEWQCVKKKQKEFCEVYGEKYKIGERFVTKDCAGSCRCTSSTSFGCVSLCPPVGIHCPPGTRKARTVRPVFGGSNCTCPSWKCVRVQSKWHPWSNWTECDAKCNGGLRYRFRKCMRNELCFGPDIETEVCNVIPCSQSYPDAPCGALRINSVEGDIWPRCDDQGYFEPLQCDPSASQCWCVDRWGNIEPRSRHISQKPQCVPAT